MLNGEFSGEGFLRGSSQALVLGGRITGPSAFEGAEALRVLTEGELAEVRAPKSGLIAATRIGRIIMDEKPGPDLKILAEEVGEGAQFAQILRRGTLPRLGGDVSAAPAALKVVEELAGLRPGPAG